MVKLHSAISNNIKKAPHIFLNRILFLENSKICAEAASELKNIKRKRTVFAKSVERPAGSILVKMLVKARKTFKTFFKDFDYL